jgi:3-deoxy-7-phosphoheptulonate synthase
VESPIHRQLASGLSCPVGFKNGTSGDIDAAVNAVVAAGRAHHFLSVTNSGAAAVVATRGNRHCHVILRGGPQPNFDERSIEETVAKLTAHGARPRLMIDCSHGNCRGSHLAQLVVARELSGQIERGSPHILGVMLESNLFAGRQNFNVGEQPIGGLSITDACIGFEDTVEVLRELATARSAAW